MPTAPRIQSPPGSELSPYQRRFYDYVERHPEGLDRRLFTAVQPSEERDLALTGLEAPAPVQSWPIFLDSARASELASLSVGLLELVRELPRVAFDNDPRQVCRFYGLDEDLEDQLRRILALPRERATAMMRGDFLFSDGDLRLLEVNAYANLGGVHIAPIARSFLEIEYLRRFFAEEKVVVRFHDPWRILLAHVIERALHRGLVRDGRLDLAIVIREPETEDPRYVEPAYTALLRELAPGVEGKILICEREKLSRDGDTLRAKGEAVQIVLCYYITCPMLPMPLETEAWLDGVIDLYPGPMGYLYSDKRNLALLSEGVERGLFTGEDARLIDRHIPWTRLVQPGVVRYRRERHQLEDLLLARQEDFVLKPAQGFGGGGVVIGRFSTPEAWRENVRLAFDYGVMCVQELIASSPLRLQRKPVGSADFLMNWGLFVFDDRFGGVYLRSSPAMGYAGFIGVSSGAEQSCCFALAPASEPCSPGDLVEEWSFA